MAVNWQTLLLTVVGAITIPLYIRILYVLIRFRNKCRFSSHFYTITISQGFIDIIGFLCYYSSVNMRSFDALKPFYWSLNGTFFVTWSYMQTYLFEYGRILGVAMISIQRVSTVTFPTSTFNQTHYLKSALIPLIASIICAVNYGILIHTLKKSTFQMRRRETKMSVQVVGLLVALLITCVHFCMQYIFNSLGMTRLVYEMRFFTPLWVGMLTFINPWMIILMNRELRRMALWNRSDTENSSVFPVGGLSRVPHSSRDEKRKRKSPFHGSK
ncbi:unnamed protein product [Nippostrongylus brasiliensis]|uniref:Serpentine receptor class gamma n=1 Tax=Nippostrongylus brasiliensis TaxID=27835 RepID=A0A0N4Y1I4_NIPBR|nr:unnamed protein product [Nippostrongylus brasiliensis]